jgi:hypothetical protein
MAQIGSLSVNLTLETAAFIANISKAQATIAASTAKWPRAFQAWTYKNL